MLSGIDLDGYVGSEGYDVPWSRFSKSPWSLERLDVGALMEKIQQAGRTLKDFADIQPFYGIKTGLNEAFVISDEVRKSLIASDPICTEIIKPFLRGQDIKRWTLEASNE